jgi:hypothetical protein
VCTQVADGRNGLQLWKVAADLNKKQLPKADKGWSSKWRDEHGG